jgi:trimeric autotransporter adhesin
MKKIILFVSSFLLVYFLKAQTPDAFNYQAVARTSTGTIMNSQNISVRMSILNNGTDIYTEEHAITTNQYGLFTINIGEGNTTLGDFSSIDWTAGSHSIQVEMDENGGSNFTLMGTSPLLTVPFAMHAKTAENTFSGDYNDLVNTPTVPVNTSDLNNDAGFITSPDDADASANNELQNLSLSGTSLSISNGNTINLDVIQDGFEANTDNQSLSLSGSTLSISNGNSIVLPSSGGASALNDLSDAKTDGTSVFVGTLGANDDGANSNTAVGTSALRDNTSGMHNASIGGYSMMVNTIGSRNTAMGYLSLYLNEADDNTAIGYQSMKTNSTGTGNVAVGGQTLLSNTTGNNNVSNGYYSLNSNTTGYQNIAIGSYALRYNQDGQDNVAIGYSTLTSNRGGFNTGIGSESMKNIILGEGNTALGYRTLYSNSSGVDNVALGHKAGEGSFGSSNVFIGSYAGSNAGPLNNKLFIDNTNTSTPLIGGDFSTNEVNLNGSVNISNVLNLNPKAVAPASAINGDIYVNTNGHIYCYIAGVWKQLDN